MDEEKMKGMNINIYCYNPFNKNRHKTCKNLKPVQDWMLVVNFEFSINMKF